MFNIAQFSSNLNDRGTLQTNKFMVRIPPPRIIGPTGLDRILEYRANAVRIPGISFDLQNTFRYGVGPQQKFPTNVNITDIDITFVDTCKTDIWKRFFTWMNGIFDFTGRSGGSQPSYKTEYKTYYETDLRIFVYDNDGNVANRIVLKEAFPTSLGDVSLSWSDNNQLYQFTVRFAFREWYFEGYNQRTFRSGAALGPGLSAQVVPQPTESPRPTQQEGNINPGGFTPEAQTLRRQNFGRRGESRGFYAGPPQEPTN